MKEFIKKNYAVILAFVLPVLLIVVVAAVTYVPSLFLSTQYNFIYATCDIGTDYYYDSRCSEYLQHRYAIDGDKLVVNDGDFIVDSNHDGKPDTDKKYSSRIFLHDTARNESREISQQEAQSLSFNGLLTSPDGVTVSNQYDNGAEFLFFDSGSSYNYYLVKGKSKRKIDLINDDNRYYYRDNIRFLGWAVR